MQHPLSQKAQKRLENIVRNELLGGQSPFTQLNDLWQDAEVLNNARLMAAYLSHLLRRFDHQAGQVDVAPKYHFASSEDGCHLVYIKGDTRRLFTFCWSGHPALRWGKERVGDDLLAARQSFEAAERAGQQQQLARDDVAAFTHILWERARAYYARNELSFTAEQLSDLADLFARKQESGSQADLPTCAWLCQIMGITLADLY